MRFTNNSAGSRIVWLGVAIWFATFSTVWADETIPILKVGSDSYTNVTVTMVTATDLYFSYRGGMGNAKLKDLAPALQSHFHYSDAQAGAAEQAQKAGASQYLSMIATNKPPVTAHPASGPTQGDLQAEMDGAIARVKEIVNQPVTAVTPEPGSHFANWPFWFDPGAAKPDFDHVDVRATQQFAYDQYEYVRSDLNPSAYYKGSELEFNSMTKYFYTDRSVPKKKLTEDEMLEINRLYRIIGKDETELGPLNR